MHSLENEVHLIRQAKSADRNAFARLVEHYWGRVYHWLYGLTKDSHSSEDLTQETFLKVWSGLDSYNAGMSFRAWLFAIARNSWIDRNRLDSAVIAGTSEIDAPSKEPEALDRLIVEEGAGILETACGELPVHFRAAFLLWSRERMSFSEVADALGVNESTARWRVFKARKLLLRRMSAYLDETAS